ncbi:AraC family transcriptional regulator [Vibrio fortis]|uniref:AraC family transcriptional regulator n=1 Tax=Vibrio fortis TaxID=212667 RepID=A0A5N3SAU6_9VIBR|nr:AraC family transcriptional regulator [Vibrio fortis]KAB0303567.1 AraC family transcriptional regulator [Vibrio fortis]
MTEEKILAAYQPSSAHQPLGSLDIALLLDSLESRGIDCKALLSSLGLANIDWQDPNIQLSFADKLIVFKAVNCLLPQEGLGLWLGQQARLNHFGVLGYVLATSENVLEAVKSGFKYLRLNGPIFSVVLIQDSDEAIIRIENSLDIGEMLPFCCEYFFSSIVSLFYQLTRQPLKLNALRLSYPEPIYALCSHGDKYQKRFACNVEFNQTFCELCFNSDLLHEPLTSHDAASLEHYLSSCHSIMASLGSPSIFSNQVRAMLYQEPGQFPTIEQLADEFGCSSRTLRRELSKEEASYHDLLAEVRRELAKELLLNTDISVEDIGERLGYSDSANFRRAFKSWMKQTPAQFRQRLS